MYNSWRITWTNQNARNCGNLGRIEGLTKRMETVSTQASEGEKAIVRMETKIEYIIKRVDEIKEEMRRK